MGVNLSSYITTEPSHLKCLPKTETELELRKLCSLLGLSDPSGQAWRALYVGRARSLHSVEWCKDIETALRALDWRCRLLIIDGAELPEPSETKALWLVLTRLVPGLIVILVSPPAWAKPYGHVHVAGISSVGRYLHMVK